MTPLSNYVNNLRERPAHVRERVALLGAIVITLAILIIWFTFGSWSQSLPVDTRPGPLDKVNTAIKLEWTRIERGGSVLWQTITRPFTN